MFNQQTMQKPVMQKPARSKGVSVALIAPLLRAGLCMGLLIFMVACASRQQLVTWQALTDLPQPRSGQFAGVSHNTLLVAGGTNFPVPLFSGGQKVWYDTVYALESGATQWKTIGTLAHQLAYGGSITTEDGIIVIGGSDSTRHYAEVIKLNYQDNQLQQLKLPDLPQACAMMSAAKLGNTLYVAGGQTAPNSTEALNTFWSLDLAQPNAQWQQLEPWPGAARILPIVVAQSGAVYLISGAALAPDAAGKAVRRYLTDGFAYRPGQGWQRIADAPRPVVAAPALAFGSSDIFVMGGDDGTNAARVQELKDNHPGFSRETLRYDTLTNRWEKAGDYPAGLVTTTAVLWQDRIVIPGGEDRPGHRSSLVVTASVAVQK